MLYTRLGGLTLSIFFFFLTNEQFFSWFFGSVVDIDTANKALNQVNGFMFKGKPVIIQYGKQRTDLSNKNAPGLSSPGSST